MILYVEVRVLFSTKSVTSEISNDSVPVIKAVTTWDTVWQFSCGSTITPITFKATDTDTAHTLPWPPVTLTVVWTLWVAVTWVTFYVGISVVQVLTLTAGAPTSAWFTLTLTCQLVTLNAKGPIGIAVTGLAANFLGHVPVPWGRHVTFLSYNIWQTWTLSSAPVTWSSIGVSTNWVTYALWKKNNMFLENLKHTYLFPVT